MAITKATVELVNEPSYFSKFLSFLLHRHVSVLLLTVVAGNVYNVAKLAQADFEWIVLQWLLKSLQRRLYDARYYILFYVMYLSVYGIFALIRKVTLWLFRRRRGIRYIPEKAEKSSILISAVMEPFEVNIETARRATIGRGFLYGQNLITAKHNLEASEDGTIVLARPEGILHYEVAAFEALESDLAVLKMVPRDIQEIGLRSVKALLPTPDHGLFVRVSGKSQASYGLLKPHSAFGYVQYTGSTTPGFSGAAYVINGRAAGMHLGHAGMNMGYDAGYIQLLLEKSKYSAESYSLTGLKDTLARGYVEESSEDVVLRAFQRGARLRYERSPFDPDEYRVVINGKYFFVDEDFLDTLVDYEKECALARPVEAPIRVLPSVQAQIDREAMEIEAEIEQLTSKVGTFLEKRLTPGANAQDLGNMVPEAEAPASRRKSTPKPRPASQSSTPSTSGLQQIRAQRNRVLGDTSKYLNQLKKGRALLQEKFTNKHLKKSSSFSDLTRTTEVVNKIGMLISTLPLDEALNSLNQAVQQVSATTQPQ